MDLEGQVIVPPEETLGPKMKALNERQRTYVCALAVFGNDQTRAYAFAYPKVTKGSAAVGGCRLANSNAVKEAIDEYYSDIFFTVGRAVAIRTLVEAASPASNLSMKERIKASKEILDRIPGYGSKSEQNIKVTHEASTEELIAIIKENAPLIGLDASKLLEDKGIIDAEFEEVPAIPDELKDML